MADLDRVLALARLPEVTLVTFGDLMRVPASRSTLAAERAAGADVRVVYSPRDARARSRPHEPDRQVVFAGIGFETTAPTIAAALLEARRRGLANFSAPQHAQDHAAAAARAARPGRDAHQRLPPARATSASITGTACYEFLARDYGVAGVVAGFEAHDVLRGAARCSCASREPRDRHRVHAGRAPGGQRRRAAPAGAGVRAERRRLARPRRHPRLRPARCARSSPTSTPRGASPSTRARRWSRPGCRCGEVLRGVTDPAECALFGARCTPEDPVGACMVCSEGACAARYRYRGLDDDG